MATGPETATAVRRVGFFPRFAAEIIDLVVMWMLIGAASGGLWALARTLGVMNPMLTLAAVLVGLIVGAAYWTILHGHGHQTVGKLVIGAVVVDTELRTIGFGRALGRLVAEIASALPFNLGYLWALWDPERQTFHDKLAGTLVVRKDDLAAGHAPAG